MITLDWQFSNKPQGTDQIGMVALTIICGDLGQ
jgi:hypothetical protein